MVLLKERDVNAAESWSRAGRKVGLVGTVAI